MARPEIIARLHGAYHDWLWDKTNADLQAEYQRLLDEVSRLYGTDLNTLRKAMAADYRDWRKQEGLPLPPRD
jgi:hypothetical protein